MTPQQVQSYFGTDVVYIFDGTAENLESLMIASNTSYNYIVDGDTQTVYFVTTGGVAAPENSRISRM